MSWSEAEFCRVEAGPQHERLEVSVADRGHDGVVEVVEVIGNEVGQGRVLGMTPEGFDWVEVWRVSRQPFDSQPRRATLL